MQPSIIIADDHPLILKGLYDFLIEKGYNVIDSAKDGKEALALIKSHKPEIAILDIQMPHLTGLEVADKCKMCSLETKIILITLEKDEKIFNEAKSLKVYGYVLKEFALAEIENCISSVIEDKSYFSPDLIKYLKPDTKPEILNTLTNTEKKVLRLITKNKTASEIGTLMHSSRRTIEKHKSNIIKKLDIEKVPNSLLIWAKDNQDYLL